MKTFVAVLMILAWSQFGYSQVTEPDPGSKEAKNSFVGSIGSVLLVSTATISYERKITTFGPRDESSLWAKGRYSKFAGWISEPQDKLFDLTMFALLGGGRSFTELSLGVGMTSGNNSIWPAASVGYRFQKREGGIIFRTGAGFPELFYLGLGYSF